MNIRIEITFPEDMPVAERMMIEEKIRVVISRDVLPFVQEIHQICSEEF